MALVLHPTYELYEKKNVPFCSSLQVAESFGKRHDNVLKDIEALRVQAQFGSSTEINLLKSEEINGNQSKSGPIDTVADFFKENFRRTSYTDTRGRKQPMYLMAKNGFTLLVMGYTGEKAMRFKIAYIKRFDAMEAFIRDYIASKSDFLPFTRAVQDAYDEPQSFHYSNECDMINRIVLGMDARHFRELHGLQSGESIRPYLTNAQAKCVRRLQVEDISLLYKGADYDTRKQVLSAFFMNRYAEALRA